MSPALSLEKWYKDGTIAEFFGWRLTLVCDSLDALCTELMGEFERDPKGAGVAHVLSEYAQQACDWSSLCFFDGERYTRNLVHRCGTFELLLLCWDEGQESAIHDHAGQDCWMAVLDGELEETHFRAATAAGTPLEAGKARVFSKGQVAYIHDEIALHLIRPRGGRGVSLHLYASPIDACLVFQRETGASEQAQMGYFSVRGERCERSAAEVRAEWEESAS